MSLLGVLTAPSGSSNRLESSESISISKTSWTSLGKPPVAPKSVDSGSFSAGVAGLSERTVSAIF